MDKEVTIVLDYINRGYSSVRYKQVLVPYAMVKLTSRVTMMDGSVLKTLIAFARVSVKGVCDGREALYDVVVKVTDISRPTFYRHMKILKDSNAIRKFGPFILINPMFVSVGRRTEVARLWEIYNELDVLVETAPLGQWSRKIKNSDLNGLITAFRTRPGARFAADVKLISKYGKQ